MGRPPCCRRVAGQPLASVFKPAGVPRCKLDEVVMTLDEFEAVRLADLAGLYQEQAAERMGISRPTFGRIVEAAHRKIAEALVHGRALRIEGGVVRPGPVEDERCPRCARAWVGPDVCPRCRDESAPGRGPADQPSADQLPADQTPAERAGQRGSGRHGAGRPRGGRRRQGRQDT